MTVEDDELRLAARDPGPNGGPPSLSIHALPDIRGELVSQLRPSFIPDLGSRSGRSVLVDVAGFRGLVSSLRVPVALQGRAVAVLALGWETVTPEPEPAWLATVQRLADHAAVALEKERRVEAQRDAARLYRRFEASLVPHLGARAGELRVGVSYSPGERRMRLGGDFVDLVTDADGTVRAVIGDVAGHGPNAAAIGAHLRAAWHALARRRLGAAEAMKTLNQLIMEESDRAETEDHMPVIATVCAVELPSHRSTATFVSAGHPPALLLHDGEVMTMPLGGLPLGVESSEWQPASVALPSSWSLLLYTDGVIEAHADPTSQARIGIDGLIALLAGSSDGEATTSAGLGRLMAAAESTNGGPLADDATLLALSRDDCGREAS